MTTCILINGYQRFGGTCCPHLQPWSRYGPLFCSFSFLLTQTSGQFSHTYKYLAIFKYYVDCVSCNLQYKKSNIIEDFFWRKPSSRRSQWPRGLRCRSAAARLLRLWFRIPPGAWMFVFCKCCVLSGRGLCDELITLPEESYRLWCVNVCDLETSWMRRPWPTGGCCANQTNFLPAPAYVTY